MANRHVIREPEAGPPHAGPAATAPVREDDLLRLIRGLLDRHGEGVLVGVGDDAAVVEGTNGPMLLTADLLVEGVHFTQAITSARDLGFKALMVNASDVAAMGGRPTYALVSLSLPAQLQPEWAMDLCQGLGDAAADLAVEVVGGDTARSDTVVISVAMAGEAVDGVFVTRSGARPGDRVMVTGELGAAAGGLRLAEAAGRERAEPADAAEARLLAAFLRPRARVREGRVLAACGATAMMDVSDGLSTDLSRLCRASGVGARIDLARLPVAAALRELDEHQGRAMDLALHGGEDYELLVTLPVEAAGRATQELLRLGLAPLTDLGEVMAGEQLLAVDAAGRELALEPRGWDHFAS